ncbi:MAG: hypothetical protein OHK93_003469 [Ramalina farinacea]|uniref:Histone chaperone domain-containing protein n=1 Tax=Ramalina farinacea TaxID=258253 RepID=A0AA43U1A0_9LECA|nr:hypothetical protein [Ramalina farinacea]
MSAEADQEARNEYIPSGKIDDSDITVAKDEAPVEEGINTATEDSDEQLQKDDSDAIDKSNIIGGRTRGAKPQGGYSDPDEDDLPIPKDQQ